MMTNKFRILSIDGGGVRGLLAIKTLRQIEAITGKKVPELFDMIVGTSTGGLIACGLSVGNEDGTFLYDTEYMERVYTEGRATIFPPQGFFTRLIGKYFNPAYSPRGLEEILAREFEDKRLADCLIPIQIATYDIAGSRPIFFKTRHGIKFREEEDINVKLFDVCRATSAGPTYFSPHSFYLKDRNGTAARRVNCIDGGVYINNPSLSAIAEVIKHAGFYSTRTQFIALEDICLLSLGTGSTPQEITFDMSSTWGAINWVRPLINIMMDGVNQVTDYKVKQFLMEDHYLRVDLHLPKADMASMDNASNDALKYLLDQYQIQVLQNEVLQNELEKFAKQLVLT